MRVWDHSGQDYPQLIKWYIVFNSTQNIISNYDYCLRIIVVVYTTAVLKVSGSITPSGQIFSGIYIDDTSQN